ncbi:hypothetical protein [Azohydromonas aeria]|uniref:hypothetical protein n=1 Tax=Azohydromonas aeria TaxID=2590212 RepID=UPI0012F8D0E5|nr:hypothetical protein [Azohydromonas aeria]
MTSFLELRQYFAAFTLLNRIPRLFNLGLAARESPAFKPRSSSAAAISEAADYGIYLEAPSTHGVGDVENNPAA